jgi:hypothetical protein
MEGWNRMVRNYHIVIIIYYHVTLKGCEMQMGKQISNIIGIRPKSV